jgi:polar amino acid transport system substrate-binding protein
MVRFTAMIAVWFGLASLAAAGAEPVMLAFTEFYPITHTEDGHPAGAGVGLAERLTMGLPIRLNPEAIPLRRLLMMTEARPIIVAALIRTPKREEQFHWIGELYRDSLVMVTKAPNRRIDTLQDARALGHIGVTLGGIAETLLEERHFTNYEASLDMLSQARKLASGRVDAWCALKQSARTAWVAAGEDATSLEMGADLVPASIWMAASLSVPPEIVAELRRRFALSASDGTLDTLLASLR